MKPPPEAPPLSVMPARLMAQTASAPIARPATPPIRPCTTDSPATWPTTRPLLQPIALSVPSSRVRRLTPDTVNRIARPKAPASTMTLSQVPSVPIRLDAVDREPVTPSARSDCVLTEASGSSPSIAAATASTFSAESTCT